MKKSITKGIVPLLLLTAGFLGSLTAQAAVIPFPQAFQQVAVSLSNPESIAHYMWKNFSVESDQTQFGQEEKWQSPEELLINRRGDCEDFARFAYEILKSNGTKAWLVSIYGRGYGHTIVVFQEKGFYHAIDGTEVKRFNAKSLLQVFEKIYPFWQKAALVKAQSNGPHAVILKEFRNKA